MEGAFGAVAVWLKDLEGNDMFFTWKYQKKFKK